MTLLHCALESHLSHCVCRSRDAGARADAVGRLLPMKACIDHTRKALQLAQAKELLNLVRHGVVLPLDGKDGVHVLGFMPCYLADKISVLFKTNDVPIPTKPHI